MPMMPVFFETTAYSRQVASPEAALKAIADHCLMEVGFATDDAQARDAVLTAIKMFAGQGIAYRQWRQDVAVRSALMADAKAGTHDPAVTRRADAEADSSLYWSLCRAGEAVEQAIAEFTKRMDEDRIAIARQDETLAANDDQATETAA